jgi:hypothetical protein
MVRGTQQRLSLFDDEPAKDIVLAPQPRTRKAKPKKRKTQPEPRALAKPKTDDYTDVDVFEVFRRETEPLPGFAPVDLVGELHFQTIYAAGKTLCGKDTKDVALASWFWCATCKRPAGECPATFCPECWEQFQECLGEAGA